jgi:predicted Zn finger-like uncharacterized protein
MRLKCPECDARVQVSDYLEEGEKVKCPDCKTRFTWSEDDDEPLPKKRKKQNTTSSFPVIPVVAGVSGIVIAAVVVVVVVVLNSKSKKDNADSQTDTADGSKVAPKFEPPNLRQKSPNEKGAFPQFGQNIPQTNPKPKATTTPMETTPAVDPWENNVHMQLYRNPEKFIGQTLIFEAHMAQSIKGTKERPQYGIIHIGTGAWSDDRIYFTSSQAVFMKMANSKDPALTQFHRVRLTMKVEDRKIDKLQVVDISKFEFLNSKGELLLSLE